MGVVPKILDPDKEGIGGLIFKLSSESTKVIAKGKANYIPVFSTSMLYLESHFSEAT